MSQNALNALRISEIFYSIQGEAFFAGFPCAFIRLAGCGHGCNYCDTSYAEEKGELMAQAEIIKQALSYHAPIIEITGGEPLLQPAVYPLMEELCNRGEQVLLETGGFLSVEKVDKRVHKIIDLKAPSSGVAEKNNPANIRLALEAAPEEQRRFEFKMVIANREDYEWAKTLLEEHHIAAASTVTMGTVFGALSPTQLAEWILHDRLPVRLQLQLHKYLWEPSRHGV
uniref:7-carboxy-7-deazaguanine synthase n=1 Tax=Chlorobium chlorochromatii (strain CaD3) TaxID=340177 RepID=Q3AT97_CHLCH